MRVLALNAGSSSVKFALFEGEKRICDGQVSGIGHRPRFMAGGIEESWEPDAPATLAMRLLDWVEHHGGQALDAVGHRVVHGGSGFSEPVRIDRDILERIEALTPLAPLHQPASVAPMRLIAEERPELPQIACFDTAFHHHLPPPVSRYPLPRDCEEVWGIRRFGFHGLSYEAIAETLRRDDPAAQGQRIVVAHLGQGASLCALRDLRSVDTTMGFTALDGIMMGTRPGALDPGILLYLLKEKGFSADELEDVLYHRSGLLGVSGISSDMAELLASPEPAAGEAIDLYCFLVARHVAALAVTLGGLDRLVFTGGVGQHAPAIRGRVTERLRWMGITVDGQANASSRRVISASTSAVAVEVIPTDEERVISAHVARLLWA